jgi:hypothetical protein
MTSEGGLALKADAQARSMVRFIEADSELTWTDESGMRGGLRFTELSAEALEQIREWLRQPELVASNGNEMPFPVKAKSPFLAAIRPTVKARQDSLEKLKNLFERARSIQVRGFSGGLLAGVLLCGVLYFSGHAHELGDRLIGMGERLGGRSAAQSNSAEVKPVAQQRSFADPQAIMPELMKGWSEREATESVTKPAIAQVKPVDLVRELPKPKLVSLPATMPPASKASAEKTAALAAQTVTPAVSKNESANSPVANSASSAVLAPAAAAVPVASVSANESGVAAAPHEVELAKAGEVHLEPAKPSTATGVSSFEKYLEIGKFREKLLASEKSEQLTDLGFPSTVIPRSHLFGKSYQVLVGPYGEDRDAESAHKKLESRGYTPRSYERGKRDFTLPKALVVNGKRVPAGACVVSWESYKPDAIVRIADEQNLGVTLDAKWVAQPGTYEHNAVAYRINRDGTKTLVEIRFSGMKQSLVFGGK